MNASILLLLALGATSKLGPVVLSDTGDGVETVLDACPKVTKWVLSSAVAAQTINDFPSLCGFGAERVISVPADFAEYGVGDDPVQAAGECWNAMLPTAGLVTPNGVWVEGPHGSFLPSWSAAGGPAWLAKFWTTLSDRISGQGFRPLFPAYGVTDAAQLAPLVQEMKKRSYAWGWAFPAFSDDLSTDVCGETDGALAFRALRDAAGLTGKTLFLTDAGLNAPGWERRGTTEEEYLAWLRWFDARLQDDPEVEGAALFQFGDSTSLADFDLAPLAEELAAHLSLAAIPSVPAGKTECGSDGEDGVDGGSGEASGPSGGPFQPGDPDDWESGCSCGSASAAPLLAPLLFAAAVLLRRGSRRG